MKQRIPNTFGINVSAQQVVTATNIAQLQDYYTQAKTLNLPVLILGEGSNTLFTEDFAGMVIINRIGGISVTESDNSWHLRVGAGERWHRLVEFTIEQQIPGLENLALIPGCVGSAPIQNIGAYGVEFEKFAEYVELLNLTTGEIVVVTDGQYGYRESIFKQQYQHNYVVTTVGLVLSKQWVPILNYGELKNFDPATVTSKMIFDKVCEIRCSKLPDPKLLGNAGSFFKNPVIDINQAELLLNQYPTLPIYPQANGQVKVAAGWLIDQCGLKGYQIGGAAVHQQQALVLINQHQATAQDIVALAAHVRNAVLKKFNIALTPEIRFMGGEGEIDAVSLLCNTM